MSPSILAYLFGMASIFVGERLLDAYAARWALDLLGVVALVLAIVLRLQARGKSDGTMRTAHHRLFVFSVLGVASLFLYGISTEEFVRMVGFGEALTERWQGVFGVLWPIMWLVATFPLVALDRVVDSSPVKLPKRRVEQAMLNGLIAAVAFCLVFPVNYIASRHPKVWDYSYFKTSLPGTATQALVNGLSTAVEVTIFQPVSSDVTPELQRYFETLRGANLRVKVVDQAADPRLAQSLKVRNNGIVALSLGPDGPERKVQFVEVGTELKRARAALKKLDQEVNKALIVLSRGELKAYVTSGHGELTWERTEPEHRRLSGFKQLLEYSGYQVAELGVDSGLSDEIPEDAALVVIAGAEKAFHASEIAALTRYLERGGSVLLALEPGRPEALGGEAANLGAILELLGIKQDQGILASDQQIVQMVGGRLDRMNITTGSFSAHASSAVLASQPSGMMFSRSSSLTSIPNSRANAVATVRTTAQTWLDTNMNLEFDADAGESRMARPLAMASTGGTPTFRAVVTGDATLMSDFAIVARGNQQFLTDALNWLSRTESSAGVTESEEDVRIQHTREGQAIWFYMTVLGLPLIIVMAGLVRTRRRGGEV